MLHKLWFRALASSAPWFPRPPCQRASRGRLRSFRIAGLTALPPGWQHPACSRTWLRVPPGQGDSTVCACARPSVRVMGPGCSWPRGCCAQRKPVLTHQQPAPWGRRSPKGTLLAPTHCFASCRGQALFIYGGIFTAGPAALLLFPQPSGAVPFVIASGPCSLGDGIVALGLPLGSSLPIALCSPSPRAHFLPLFPQLAERGAALGGPSPQDVLSTTELPVTGDDDNPGGTSESTNVSVAQHPWVAASPSFSTPLPPIAPGWCINQGEPRFFSPRPSTFGSSGICMAAA